MMPFEFFTGVFCQRLTWALLHFLWQGFVVAGVMNLLLWRLRRGRAESRYTVCLAGLLLMAACPVLTFSALAQWPPQDGRPALDGLVPAPQPVAFRPEVDHFPAVESTPALRPGTGMAAIQPCLLAGWAAGVLLLGLKLLLGLVGLRRLMRGRHGVPAELAGRAMALGKRLGLRRCRTIFLSEEVSEAIAIGFVRSTVLLPAAWLLEMTPEVFGAVVAHELAHVRRGDLWVNLLQRVIEALLFYHPAVWWLSRRIRGERELCCDALAVAATGQRVDYLHALQWVAQKRTSPTSPRLEAAMGGSDMALLNRVRHLIGAELVRGKVQWWPAGLAILTTLCGLWLVTCLSTTDSSQALAAEQAKPLRPGVAAQSPTPRDVASAGLRDDLGGIRPDSEGVIHEAPFVWPDFQALSKEPPKPVPRAKGRPRVAAGKNVYQVQSAIIRQQGDGQPERLQAPRITVVEGVRAIFSDVSQTPIVSAVKGNGDAKKPTIHVLNEGITANITAYGNEDGRVTLDARVELSRIVRVDVKDGRQTTLVKTQRVHTIDCVRPGDKVVAPFDPVEGNPVRTSVEFVVTQIKPSEQGTPGSERQGSTPPKKAG